MIFAPAVTNVYDCPLWHARCSGVLSSESRVLIFTPNDTSRETIAGCFRQMACISRLLPFASLRSR